MVQTDKVRRQEHGLQLEIGQIAGNTVVVLFNFILCPGTEIHITHDAQSVNFLPLCVNVIVLVSHLAPSVWATLWSTELMNTVRKNGMYSTIQCINFVYFLFIKLEKGLQHWSICKPRAAR